MKTPSLWFLFVLLSSPAILSANAAKQQQLETWREALKADDLRVVNDQVTRLAIEWPKIYSAGRKIYDNESERQLNEDYAKLSARLSDVIFDHVSRIAIEAPNEAIMRVEELLRTRSWLSKSPSYRNYVLVDTINRHALVRLMQLLRAPNAEASRVIQNLDSLSNFSFDPSAWMNMIKEERGANVGADAQIFASYHKDSQQLALEHAALRDIKEYQTIRLLGSDHFAALGWRMVVSDYYLRSVTPSVVEYWQKESAPTIADEYAKIREVIGKDALVADSVGAKFLERRRASAAVYEFLEQTRTGRINDMLLLTVAGR
jgi:hypothetical protein